MSPSRKTVIESIRVDGFGRFHDFELELGDGLNVLAGPNEAGKSTLWSFISAMLFGFERRSEATRYEPVGGSAFGGELRLKTVGGRVVVRRQGHKRRVDGEVTLRDGNGAPLPDSRLDEARGQVSRELFAQVFSLTIDQLRTFGDLAGSEVSERLFAAAMQGAQRLPSALETLRKESAELFLPKGQRPINTWLRELQGVRLQLEALGDRPAEYANDKAQRERLEAALVTLELEVSTAQAKAREIERLQKSMGPLTVVLRAEAVQAGHEQLAHFPLEAVGRAEGLMKALREATSALRAAEHEASVLKTALETHQHAAAARTAPEPIRAALRQWDTVLVQARELPAALAQLEARQRQIAESMKRLPVPKADLEWLAQVDVSVAVQTELKSLRDRHAQAREERARVMAALMSARDELTRRRERAEHFQTACAAIEQVDVSSLEDQLSALAQVAGLKQRQSHLASQRASVVSQLHLLEVPQGPAPRARLPLWLAGIGALALVVCGLAAWAIGVGPSALLFALVLGLCGMVVAWRDEQGTAAEAQTWSLAQRHQLEQRAQRRLELATIEAGLLELDSAIESALHRGHVRQADEDVSPLMASLRTRLEHQLQRATLSRQHLEAAHEAQRVAFSVTALEAERARADAALDLVQSEVDERLAPLRITASLAPEAALDVVADVHRLQERALSIETERAGLVADSNRVAVAVRLLELQATAAGLGPGEPMVLASMLHDWLEADGHERSRAATLKTRLESAAAPLAQHQTSVSQLAAEIDDLLRSAHVPTIEAFRHRATEAQRWAAAELERRGACATIAALGGEVEAMKGLALDESTLAQEALLAGQALESARAQRESTLELLGRVRARLERFEVEDEAAGLRREEEGLLVRIRQAVEQYTVASLARTVLEQTRERFDAEQQPRVVQRAGSLFAELTANRYVQVRPDQNARVLTVRDAQGVTWQVEQLSRGTRELLLLAFRLAVVEDFGEVRVALPVLLDDITVNLDADRAARVVEVLARLSKRHQILALTCHSQVRALFREAGARVHEVAQRTQLSLLGT